MAEITPTNRVVSSHGHLKKETGTVVLTGSQDSVHTKLTKILFLSIQGQSTDDNTGVVYLNSESTAGTTEPDNGWFYHLTGLTAGTYNYEAFGTG